MPAFSYVVLDAQGRTKRGIVEAETARQARSGLREAGLVPVELGEIDPEAAAGGLRRLFAPRHRLSGAELALFTRRFALLLEAGLTVEQCLDALIEQAQNAAGGRTLMTVRAEVLAGHGLAVALDRHPSSFPDIYRALVGTGEQSGELARVMLRLADYLEARHATRQNAGLALLLGGIINPLYSLLIALTNDYLSKEDMPGASAGLIFLNGFGAIFGPLLSGWFMAQIGPGGYFLFLGLLFMVLAAYAAWRISRRSGPVEQAVFTSLSPNASSLAVGAVMERDPRRSRAG